VINLCIKIQHELDEAKQQLEFFTSELDSLPEGSLNLSGKGGIPHWYRLKDKEDGTKLREYIKLSDQAMLESMTYKRYCNMKIKELNKFIKATEKYLTILSAETVDEKMFSSESPFKEYLIARVGNPFDISEEIENWLNAPYKKAPITDESHKVRTARGVRVRSKSEAMIVDELTFQGIPFRYECEFVANRHTYYPDFTIKHPKTGKIYLWEHFGLLDQSSYRSGSYNKVSDYLEEGFYLGYNLICTVEWNGIPLDGEWVHLIIQHFFKSE